MKKRLEIRFLELSDYLVWKAAYELQNAPKNDWDHSHRKSDTSKSAFKKYLKNNHEQRKIDRAYYYGIFEKKTGALVGFIMAVDVVRSITQTAILGYTLFNNYWGQGYMQEAIKSFYQIAFKDLGLHRLQAGIEPHNKRSLKVAKALGFRREGLSKNIIFLRGEWQDLVQFAITCEDVGIKWKGKATKNY